jgi:hypothetical protein
MDNMNIYLVNNARQLGANTWKLVFVIICKFGIHVLDFLGKMNGVRSLI